MRKPFDTKSVLDACPADKYQSGMNVLRHLRSKAGLSQQGLATAVGTSQPQIKRLEAGERTLSKDWAERLAPHLGVDARTLLFPPAELAEADVNERDMSPGSAPPPEMAIEANAIIPAKPEIVDRTAFMGPRNVPVLGTGVGGDNGDFRFNGQTIDHAPRPPGIANRSDVYVVYLAGDSVSPAYEDGTPIYVDPHRRPAPRDYVVVEMRGESEGEPGPSFVKRLIRRGGGKIYLEQHKPAKELDPIDEVDVARVHRVIPWMELLGL